MQPTKDRPDRQSFQLFLPSALHHRLKITAAEMRTTANAIIVEAVEAHLFPQVRAGEPKFTPNDPANPRLALKAVRGNNLSTRRRASRFNGPPAPKNPAPIE
jgi:hypothetical protein